VKKITVYLLPVKRGRKVSVRIHGALVGHVVRRRDDVIGRHLGSEWRHVGRIWRQ